MLWRAVAAQAVRDLYSPAPKARRDVVLWTATDDFEAVCCAASLPAKEFREQLLALASLSLPLAKKYGRLLRERIVENLYD